MTTRPKGLGRGLAALLGADEPSAASATPDQNGQALVSLSQLAAGRYQPRARMDESALHELAESISRYGLMQPILVRPIDSNGNGNAKVGAHPQQPASIETRYEIIAGERRFRAAQIAGLKKIPVIVRAVPDEQALALALIENIQREDLSPLDEAHAIKRLLDEFGYTHDQASSAIGRSRSATSNLLRLLNLAEPVQTMLLAGDIDMGHARALLPLDRAGQTMLAQQVAQRQLSVRETERLVATALRVEQSDGSTAKKTTSAKIDRDLLALQNRLCDALATEVRLIPNSKGGGKLMIAYSSVENFEGLLARLGLNVSEAQD